MLRLKALYLVSAALLLASPVAHGAPALNITLAEPGCPAVTASLLVAFTTNTDGTTAVTGTQAAALACHLKPVLTRAAAGQALAKSTLSAMHTAWRGAFHPQPWSGNMTDSKALGVWTANLQAVVTINLDSGSKFWAGLNAYSAMAPSDWAASVLMTPAPAVTATKTSTAKTESTAKVASTTTKKSGGRKLAAFIPNANGTAAPPPAAPAYPASVNWLVAGKVLPQVAFQAECASSYAFAVAAALESKLMIQSGANATATAALSAQYIMDCTASMFNYTRPGCAGGSLTDALTYASKQGIPADSAYHYRPANSGSDKDSGSFVLQCDRPFLTCQTAKSPLVQITGSPAFKQVSPASNKAALLQALAAQPAVATLAVDASFQHYAGGIWTSSACASFPNHALLLVGYSTLPAGSEYILAKSSLGAAWGEAGFARIAMTADGSGTCGLYLAALQPGTVTLAAPASPAPAPTPAPAKNDTKPAAPTPAPAKNDTKPAAPTPAPAKNDTKPAAPTPAPAKNDTKPAVPIPTPTPAPAKNDTKSDGKPAVPIPTPTPAPAKNDTKSDGKPAAPAPPASKTTTTTKH